VLRGSYPDGVLQHFYNMVLTKVTCEAVLVRITGYYVRFSRTDAAAPTGTVPARPARRRGRPRGEYAIPHTIHSLQAQQDNTPGTLDAANRHTPVKFTPQTNFDAQIACQFGPSVGMAGRRGPTVSDPQTDEPLIP